MLRCGLAPIATGGPGLQSGMRQLGTAKSRLPGRGRLQMTQGVCKGFSMKLFASVAGVLLLAGPVFADPIDGMWKTPPDHYDH